MLKILFEEIRSVPALQDSFVLVSQKLKSLSHAIFGHLLFSFLQLPEFSYEEIEYLPYLFIPTNTFLAFTLEAVISLVHAFYQQKYYAPMLILSYLIL